jgi:ribonuclease G
VKKEWFLDRYCGQQFAALVEDGRLIEFSSEKEPRVVCVGNIYKGRVTNVVAGMHAAFINCELGKNCYLSTDDTYTDYTKYDGTMSALNNENPPLNVGDEVLVQITQNARGNKGAKVTKNLSIVGKHLIYLPNTAFVGISRKIKSEAERARLLESAEALRDTQSEGFIVRTQAAIATQKQLKAEADYLKNIYRTMLETAKTAPVGTVLYEDEDLPVRVIRDSLGESVSAFHVGDEELYQRLLGLVRLQGVIPEEKLIKYNGERSMFMEYGITPLVYDAARPTVPLEKGGSLVIEHTEAMTVVDVNTGKFIGTQHLEETVFEMNLIAAREIARQVRLRNVGGIVAVDFIDMADEAHRLAVNEELKACLAQDNTKCNVLPMNELCITTFTRKRVGNDVLSYLVKPCVNCGGMGHVHEDIYVVTRLRSRILDCFAEGNTVVIADVNAQIMKKIISEEMFAIEMKGRWKDKKIYLIPHKTYKEDFFSIRGEKTDEVDLPEFAHLLK